MGQSRTFVQNAMGIVRHAMVRQIFARLVLGGMVTNGHMKANATKHVQLAQMVIWTQGHVLTARKDAICVTSQIHQFVCLAQHR